MSVRLLVVGLLAAAAAVAQVSGVVRDQQAGMVVGATVTLDTVPVQTKQTGAAGEFSFSRTRAGVTMRVSAVGFADYQGPVRSEIVLLPAILTQSVTVTPNEVGDALDDRSATGTQVLRARDLQGLADDPDQFNQQLQQLAAAGGSTPGSAQVTVDGFLSDGRLPPKSSIREVRINPDLFSAEYDTPPYRGGRIEIVTKPGTGEWQGAAFLHGNTAALNARDAFAAERADVGTVRYGAQIGGPLVRSRWGLLFDFERRAIRETVPVDALILPADLSPQSAPVRFLSNVPQPRTLTVAGARLDGQLAPRHTLAVRLDLNLNIQRNQGVGGFRLPEHGTDARTGEWGLRTTWVSTTPAGRVNEMRVGFTRGAASQQALSALPALLVPGAFEAGGAVSQGNRRTDHRLEIADALSFMVGRHVLKLGGQLLVRSVTETRAENANGAFLFGGVTLDGQARSGLEQYRRARLGLPGGIATRYSVTLGVPTVVLTQALWHGFIQNDFRWRPRLSVSMGLRYEGQTSPRDYASLAPRFGFALAPDQRQRWVLRVRGGLFYSRLAEALSLEALRLDGSRQRQVLIDHPPFPDPFASAAPSSAVPLVRTLASGLGPPVSGQVRFDIERQLPGAWKLQASYSRSASRGMVRTENVNAPLSSGQRPWGEVVNRLQFAPGGRLAGNVWTLIATQNASRRLTLTAGYLRFDFRTNADSPFLQLPAYGPTAADWARPAWQQDHVLFAVAGLSLPGKWQSFWSLNGASGRPLNLTTGRDNNGDGAFNDRPRWSAPGHPSAVRTPFGWLDPTPFTGDVPRNFATNPATFTVDLNVSRSFVLGAAADAKRRPSLTFSVRATNLLNRTNPLPVSGVLASPLFLVPNAAEPSRRIEAGLRLQF